MKSKKFIAMALTVILICGSSLTSSAAPRAVHTHAYSNMGSYCYYSSVAYSHDYYQGGVYKKCDVVQYYYRDVFECACGASYYENYRSSFRHTALCGQ